MLSLSTTISRSPGGPFLNQFVPQSAQELREGHIVLNQLNGRIVVNQIQQTVWPSAAAR